MNSRQIQYLLAVVEEGSFTRAAMRLDVAQPSLSQQILALERELGGALLERLPGGVQLTAAGRAFLPDARAAVASSARAAEAAKAVLGEPGRELEVATVTSLAVGLLPAALAEWHRLHAETSVRLDEFSHRQTLFDAVRSGRGDLGIGPRPPGWTGPIVELGWEEFVIVLPTNDPLARGPGKAGITLGELADRDWVLFGPDHGFYELIQRVCAKAGFIPRAAVRTAQVTAAAQLAAAGLGPAFVGTHAVPAGLDAALIRLKPRLVRELTAFTRTAWSPAAQEFLKVMSGLPRAPRPRGSEQIS